MSLETAGQGCPNTKHVFLSHPSQCHTLFAKSACFFPFSSCDGYSENSPWRVIHLNVWFLISKLFKKGSELWSCWRRHITWVWLWGFKSPFQTHSLSLPFTCRSGYKISATVPVPCLPACWYAPMAWWLCTNPLKLEASSKLNAFFFGCDVFSQLQNCS